MSTFADTVKSMTDSELREAILLYKKLFKTNKDSNADQGFLAMLGADIAVMQDEAKRRADGYKAASEHLGKLL